jgi:hypothetical protein
MLPIAVPHVELSLQNSQDLPLFRRVLSPKDLGVTSAVVAPLQDLSTNINLQLNTAQLQGQRVQGYRVLAFYP